MSPAFLIFIKRIFQGGQASSQFSRGDDDQATCKLHNDGSSVLNGKNLITLIFLKTFNYYEILINHRVLL